MSENWNAKALADARDCLLNFIDSVAGQARDGEVSNDLMNDYPDGDQYHHEQHVDHDYRLTEAAELLEALSDSEETDSGLWHGLEPRKAIACQAAYTYGNAVMARWQHMVGELNSQVLDDITPGHEDRREGYARLFVLLECQFPHDGSQAGNFAQAALADLKAADLTSALIFCDWLGVNGQEVRAAELRSALALAQTVEEPDPLGFLSDDARAALGQ